MSGQATILFNKFASYTFKSTATFPNELKHMSVV